MALRVLSYNIHSCIGTDGKYSPERVCDVIRETGADLVALQEIDSSMEVRDGVDQVQYLAKEIGMHAVIGPTLKRGYGAYGNAVLSRWPMTDVKESDLTYRKFEPRGLLQTVVSPEAGKSIEVINTHLGLKWWERRFQVAQILDVLATRSENNQPVILLGDFNEWLNWSGNLRRLKTVFGAVASDKTFPARWPRLKLDRIFVHPKPTNFEFSAVSTPLSRVASDHLPILATIEF